MVEVRQVSPDDFDRIASIVASSYEPHDPDRAILGPGRWTSSEPPLSWFGDPSLSWWIGSIEGRDVGFALWRHVGRVAHLHSMFVAADAQRRGVATALLNLHRRQALLENPKLGALTLHVHRQATWARAFYEKHGYSEHDPRSLREDPDEPLSDWRRFYDRVGSLDASKILMVREA